jgi:hypothetical protein
MSSEEKPGRFRGLHTQAFELLKVVLTLLLTGLIGGGITYYYQDRAQREQQETKELETARNSALSFLREIGDILEQRKYLAFRCMYAIRDQLPPAQIDEAWQDYMKSVGTWNVKWNLYRALILEEFGPDMQKRFYDEKSDSEGVWEHCSITGKLIIFHGMLVDYHNQTPDKPPQDPQKMEQMYSSVAQDCYAFYSEVISRVQEGRVGHRASTPTGKSN